MAVPYRWQSRVNEDPVRPSPIHARLERWLRRSLPGLDSVSVTHRWGGVLGVPRDFFPSVGFDRTRGVAWAGGYVGEGVAASNLAGRTVADLILERDTNLVRLPWVGHHSPKWEPEPWRWLGVRGAAAMFRAVDAFEGATGRHQRWASALR
jgi:glycine/D-amino acid oxidase-like deaminating enzyme